MSSAADVHAARMADRAASLSMADAPPMSPRSRLESFRAEQARKGGGGGDAVSSSGGGSRLDSFRNTRGLAPSAAPASEGGSFRVDLPSAGSSSGVPFVPGLGLGRVSSEQINAGADGRPLSSRRLKKEVLKADSTSMEASNCLICIGKSRPTY